MRIVTPILAAVILTLAPIMAFAQDDTAAKTFSPAEKTAIENVIKNYLTKENPDVIKEAIQELQRREQVSAESKSLEAIKNNKDKIFNNPDSAVGGNAKGDVTVVEFYDYQ